ncbi:MAG: hypothetical protein LAO79_15955 [Acidobacteriia bacterium]|nr:hypothetical protein [Terriglobia bacterium]
MEIATDLQRFSVEADVVICAASLASPSLLLGDTGNNRVLAYKNPAALGVCGISNASCGFADQKVIGQRDLFSTLAGGPGNPGLNTGFNRPTAVLVDSSGNLYVMDSGNNRILRFPAPFQQTGSLLLTDLVIGQKTFNSGVRPNEGNSVASAKTLYLSTSNTFANKIALDGSGNLWVPDPGNNRALRFPASQLAANTVEPTADVVLGQLDFQTSQERPAPQGNPGGTLTFKGSLRAPTSVAIAPSGAIYIADGNARVLYYLAGIQSGSVGISAFRILGIGFNLQNQPPLTSPNNYALTSTVLGLGMSGSNLYVADPASNRVVKYDVPENWPNEPRLDITPVTTEFSPPMIDVVGQNNFQNGKANKGQAEPDASTVNFPIGIAFLGTDLWVADYGNNRVTSFQQQSGKYVLATRLVGQLDWPYNSPNLIEGREVNFNFGSALAGVAIDTSSNPPHMYVADTFNNRILAFRDARNIGIGAKADLVLGQTDFYRSLFNGATNDPQLPNQYGLNRPTGLTVDSSGNLYVADTGNGRVLRFPTPFSQASGSQQLPNLVLGQPSFTSQIEDASSSTMGGPVGLVLFSDGSMAVSDLNHNRILIFKKGGGDFQNGQNASIILGQPDANSSAPQNATSAAGLNNPRQIAVDSSDRLYVADFGNSRLMIWSNGLAQTTGASSSAQFLGLIAQPQGIIVSQTTGEIWVSNSSNSQILRLPEFNSLIVNSTPTTFPVNQIIQAQTPAAAITLDASDNLIVAESANRVALYYAALTYTHSANYNQLPISPGMLISLYRRGRDFSFPTSSATAYPWPTNLSDFQVTVNGQPAPIFAMAASVLNFQVPTQNVPSSGTVEFLVTHPSTGEILASGQFQMAQYSPGFYTSGAVGSGQIAAINDDNTINSPSNPVSRDGTHYITFYMTGGGVFTGGPGPVPTDGMPPSDAAATQDRPQILSGVFAPNGIVPDGDIIYSGAGAFPGGWQISMKVENKFVPTATNVIAVQINGYISNTGPNGQKILCTFATK